MAEFWTVEQAQLNAELLAKEFSNRQILIFGFGEPLLNVPIGVEYEDRNFKPAIRYRKIGLGISEWQRLFLIEPANQEDVLSGINDKKMVTPALLTQKLNQFSAELLGIPKKAPNSDSNLIVLGLTPIDLLSTFKVVLPNEINSAIASIKIKDHFENDSLTQIEGGEIGQIINLKRSSINSLNLLSSDFLKLSSSIKLEDNQLLDNITLQKIDPTIWVELARKQFTE
tara:strand:+ start:595 stop:1275 length:681 start_codon:yes stop_codon:yes gene_type:complete